MFFRNIVYKALVSTHRMIILSFPEFPILITISNLYIVIKGNRVVEMLFMREDSSKARTFPPRKFPLISYF